MSDGPAVKFSNPLFKGFAFSELKGPKSGGSANLRISLSFALFLSSGMGSRCYLTCVPFFILFFVRVGFDMAES